MDGFKWEDIAEKLRQRILKGDLKAGDNFPTNFQLMQEFGVHTGTIQNAVNALIREGLVDSHGSGMVRRTVRPLIARTTRYCNNYSRINSNDEKFQTEKFTIIHSTGKLPGKMEAYYDKIKFPSLRVEAKIYRDKVLIALSDSLFNGYIPTKELYKTLKDPDIEINNVMKKFNLKPIYCEENLIASPPTSQEKKILSLASRDLTPVLRIRREIYDNEKELLELRFLVVRGDCYENIYHMPINGTD